AARLDCASRSVSFHAISTPIRRISCGCCARTASGNPAANPTIPAMRSRRRIAYPTGANPAARGLQLRLLTQKCAAREMGANGHFAQQQSRGRDVGLGSNPVFEVMSAARPLFYRKRKSIGGLAKSAPTSLLADQQKKRSDANQHRNQNTDDERNNP